MKKAKHTVGTLVVSSMITALISASVRLLPVAIVFVLLAWWASQTDVI